jgi:hypothetical protein
MLNSSIALPGKSINAFWLLVAGTPPAPPNCSEQCQKRAINNDIERTPPPVECTPPPVVPAPSHHKTILASAIALPNLTPDDDCDDGAITMPMATMSNNRKQRNHAYYLKKKQPMHQPQQLQQ